MLALVRRKSVIYIRNATFNQNIYFSMQQPTFTYHHAMYCDPVLCLAISICFSNGPINKLLNALENAALNVDLFLLFQKLKSVSARFVFVCEHD